MLRIQKSRVVAALVVGLVCAGLHAQESQPVLREKPINAPERPMLFAPDPEKPGITDTIWFRSADEMRAQDRAEAANAEAAIGEKAAFMGLGYDQGKWTYQQVVCPALPNHLFLQYTRNNGVGDVSLFSASVPRGGEGRVRIIPIQMRGYSLFSPAPINALTISAFNHIRAEEHAAGEDAPDWLGTALCYAALAGGRPQAAHFPGRNAGGSSESANAEAAPPATLEIEVNGAATISFADVAASPRPMEWTMSFDRKGTLLKARHAPAELVTVRKLNPAPVDEKGRATR
jgi:hypothetical protein